MIPHHHTIRFSYKGWGFYASDVDLANLTGGHVNHWEFAIFPADSDGICFAQDIVILTHETPDQLQFLVDRAITTGELDAWIDTQNS